jgi:capsular polysaccharide biosynthesis protein
VTGSSLTGNAPTGPPASASGSGQSVVTVGQFFGVLRRRLVLVLVLVLLGLVGAGLLLHQTPKTYQATAVVDISPTSSGSSNNPSSVSTITEARIVTSTSVALTAAQTLGFTGTPTDLASRVSVSSPLASQVLSITYSAGSAQGASDGANAFANAYLDYRTQIAQKDITLRIGRIQSQIADLQRSLTGLTGRNDSQRSSLQNQIQQLENQLNTYKTSVVSLGHVAGAAVVPSAASSPRPVLYLAGGVLFGLLVGIVLAVARDRRDDRVHDAAELEHSLGAPVIAESASAESGSGIGQLAAIDAPRDAEADAYRAVATTLTSRLGGSRVVLLCGTGQDGFSLAPLNLAATFAMQGLQTVLAGPRRTLEPATGLLDIQSLPGSPRTRLADQLTPSATLPTLSVLSLGDEVSLGATLRANGDQLDDVLARAEVIVLDGVNMELPSTCLRLGQLADEAVVVAYRNRSTHAGIERLVRQLGQVNTDVLGGILLTRRRGLGGRFRRHAQVPAASGGRTAALHSAPPSPAAPSGVAPSQPAHGSTAFEVASGRSEPARSAPARKG